MLSQVDEHLPLSRHIFRCFQLRDLVQHPVAFGLVRAQEIVIGDPKGHVIGGTGIIVIAATDPVGELEGAVQPFHQLLERAEFFGNRIVISKPHDLRHVEGKCISVAKLELLGGQRIGAEAISNEPECIRQFGKGTERFSQHQDTSARIPRIRNMVAQDGAGYGIHDEPDEALAAAYPDIGLIGNESV